MQRPRAHFVPTTGEPVGHFIPKGDPQVRQLSRLAREQADAYTQDTLVPQVDALRSFARAQLPDRVFEGAATRIEELRAYVQALASTIAHQVSQADALEDLPNVVIDDPTLHQAISRMQSDYPWMAPRLVRLRHAVSRQAIDEHVLSPAGDQMGI